MKTTAVIRLSKSQVVTLLESLHVRQRAMAKAMEREPSAPLAMESADLDELTGKLETFAASNGWLG